jgi:hypothetical protein
VNKHLKKSKKVESSHICSSASEAQRTFVTFHVVLSTLQKLLSIWERIEEDMGVFSVNDSVFDVG